ncbi:MAG: hypothetical protein RL220_966 [Bacteroidota bacterium]
MHRSIAGLLLYIGIILSLASCLGSVDDNSERVFRYNESNGITSLDPAYARELENLWVINQMFDGLVELDSSLHVIPCIARTWEISPDGKTYTFHLRTDVYFHRNDIFGVEGTRKVKPSDFIYSFKRIINPQTASPGKWIFTYLNQSIGDAGFNAPDDSTLIIHLSQSFQPFLGMLAMQYCNVVPEEAVLKYGAEFRSNPVGTGPFQFAFWYENEALVMHKNPKYWETDSIGNQLPYLDAIHIDFVKDMSAEFHGLLQGKYDFMSGINAATKDELLDPLGELNSTHTSTLRLQKTPFIKTDYIGFLCDPNSDAVQNSVVRDKRIRQAISYAIDKKSMIRHLRNNAVFPAENGFVPPSLLGGQSYTYYPYDPIKASSLLEEAGYPGGKGLPEIEISVISDQTDLIEYIQHSLGQVGIPVRINSMQGTAFKEKTANAQLMSFKKSWVADYADAENFLGIFLSRNFCPAGPNYMHFSNPEYDLLYEKAASETTDSMRNELYHDMNRMIMEEAAVIPLFYDQVTHFVRNEVRGLQTNPINMLDLKRVSKIQL